MGEAVGTSVRWSAGEVGSSERSRGGRGSLRMEEQRKRGPRASWRMGAACIGTLVFLGFSFFCFFTFYFLLSRFLCLLQVSVAGFQGRRARIGEGTYFVFFLLFVLFFYYYFAVTPPLRVQRLAGIPARVPTQHPEVDWRKGTWCFGFYFYVFFYFIFYNPLAVVCFFASGDQRCCEEQSVAGRGFRQTGMIFYFILFFL